MSASLESGVSPVRNSSTAADVRWHPAVAVDGVRYRRATVRTPWIRPGDDLAEFLVDGLAPLLRNGDVAIVSEKAVVIAAGLGVPVAEVTVGPLARRLAGWVRPTAGSRGLSIPEKMEYVIRQVGRVRVLTATVLAGLTRPLGFHGVFYLVAGQKARAMDGMRPPFEDLLLPPLAPRQSRRMAVDLAQRLGAPVAIVDMNDRGGSHSDHLAPGALSAQAAAHPGRQPARAEGHAYAYRARALRGGQRERLIRPATCRANVVNSMTSGAPSTRSTARCTSIPAPAATVTTASMVSVWVASPSWPTRAIANMTSAAGTTATALRATPPTTPRTATASCARSSMTMATTAEAANDSVVAAPKPATPNNGASVMSPTTLTSTPTAPTNAGRHRSCSP